MSMYPGHRGMGGGAPPAQAGVARLNELLDQIRAEFEGSVRQSDQMELQGTSVHASARGATLTLSRQSASRSPSSR